MSPTAGPRCYEAPGKVFLLGEYAVLVGLPALVACVGPRFKLTAASATSRPVASTETFAAESPAGRFLRQIACETQGAPALQLTFEDPHQGQGGFGASTAQFALTYLAYAHELDWACRWQPVWQRYRRLTAGGRVPPSGADLVAQWSGGVVVFDPAPAGQPSCEDVWPLFDWSGLLIFSATAQPGRKTATHLHLEELATTGALQTLGKDLERPLTDGLSAVRRGEPVELGRTFDEYAEVLRKAGLELPSTAEDRAALRGLPGVLGVKGAGANQSDAVLVLLEPLSPHRQRVIQAAEARGLRLVADGLTRQLGVCSARIS